MATASTGTDVFYPESDGEPMGETLRHRDANIDLILALQDWFADDPEAERARREADARLQRTNIQLQEKDATLGESRAEIERLRRDLDALRAGRKPKPKPKRK